MTELVKLSLKNFKSFKKAEIPISKGFTSIVGSNGSGKSNILDALLFVLGITSLKTLRAGKLTDLVNNDAKENYGKVDLILKDDKKQYEISRMIDKQGKSVYRLDGKRTTLNEIGSLLTDLGINVEGHNIVTQGDVTKIIEMSPVERRIIIDNIAGLSEFDAKKDEAIKELDKVDSRIKEATIILNERTNFLAELETEMHAAKEHNELEEERKRTKATILAKEIYAVEKKILEADNEIAEMEKQKAILEQRIAENRALFDEAKKKSNELSKKMIKASEQTYTTIGREFEEKKAKLGAEKEKVEYKKDIFEKNNLRINSEKELAEKEEKEKIEINEKRKNLDAELTTLEKELKEALNHRKSLEDIVRKKDEELIKEEEKAAELGRKIEDEKKASFDLEVFARNWEKQKAFNEKKLSELISEQEDLAKELKIIEEKKTKIEEKLKNKPEEKLIELEKKLTSLIDERGSFSSKRLHEEKAVKNLKEVSVGNNNNSRCPICDSELNEAKKQALAKQKEELIKDFVKKEGEVEDLIKKIRAEISKERENSLLISRLSAEISHEQTILDKLEELDRQAAKIKAELDSKNFDEQLRKREHSAQLIGKIEEERKIILEKISLAKRQNIFEDFSVASKKTEELIHKKNGVLHSLNEIKSRLSFLEEKSTEERNELKRITKENESLLKEINSIEEKITKLEAEIEEKEKALLEAKKSNAILADEKDYSDKNMNKAEKEIMNESIKLKKVESRINEFNIEKSKFGVRQADLDEEKKEFEGIEPFASKTLEECRDRMNFIEKRINELGAVNLKAVDNFAELKKEVDEIQVKSGKLSDERLCVLDMIDKIEVKRTSVFMDCFDEINRNFKEMFFKFFNGEGNLSLSEPEKPLESGLMIDAKQKGTKFQNMDSMSGGEKTLTALAFMFAIQLYRPAPFYAFDEADAALDKENSLKMSNLIDRIAEKSQFVAVTHNDVITKKASQIIGVARAKDGSSVIGLKLKNNSQEKPTELAA